MPNAKPTLITDRDEVLCRQVPPTFLDANCGIMSSAFAPSKLDKGHLSTLYDVKPAEAFRRYTQVLKLMSAGTWGIGVGNASDLDLPAYADSCLPGTEADHASVVFVSHSKGQQAQRARKLRDAALEAGPLFLP